jgi:hypothetical protein
MVLVLTLGWTTEEAGSYDIALTPCETFACHVFTGRERVFISRYNGSRSV